MGDGLSGPSAVFEFGECVTEVSFWIQQYPGSEAVQSARDAGEQR